MLKVRAGPMDSDRKRPCLLFTSNADDPVAWRAALAEAWSALEFRVWPEIGDPDEIDAALVWKPPRAALANCRNLKLVINLGAGADAVIGDDALPSTVPVARIVDPGMTRMMVAYVSLAVLRYQRDFESFELARNERRWHHAYPTDPALCRVGVMGLGQLGSAVASALAGLGLDVAGWSRRGKSIPGIAFYAGTAQLKAFLARTDILVLLLPITPQTRGLVDRDVLAALPRGARLVNAGRGATVDEGALIAALRTNHLAGATLDVFEQEPLPPGHPLWEMEQVMITPHQASVPGPGTSAAQVAENVRRALAGEPILHLVDRDRGY